MEMIWFIVRDLRIHGAIGGGTVWALSGDLWIPYIYTV
jgi:hypothetical protein